MPGAISEREFCLSTSIGSICLGVYLVSNPAGWLTLAAAGGLMGFGLSGGAYVAQTEDEDFDVEKYTKRAVSGGAGGVLSGGIGAGATLSALLTAGTAGSVGSKAAETLLEDGRLPTKEELVKQAVIGAMTAGVGAGASKLAGGFVGEVGDDVIKHALKGATEGASGGAAGKVIDNIAHNLTHDENDQRKLADGVPQAMLQGGIISGVVSAAKQHVKNKEAGQSQRDGENGAQNGSGDKEKVAAQDNPNDQEKPVPPTQPKRPVAAENKLRDYMRSGLQPKAEFLKNSPEAIIDQVKQGAQVSLKKGHDRVRVYEENGKIVMRHRHGRTHFFEKPTNYAPPQPQPKTQAANSFSENAGGKVIAPNVIDIIGREAAKNNLRQWMGNGFHTECNSNLPNSPEAVLDQVDLGGVVTLHKGNERLKVYRDGSAIVMKHREGSTARFNAPIVTQSSGQSVRVYFFSKPLSGVSGLGAFLNDDARHVGFLIDHPEHGLIKYENTAAPGKSSSFQGVPITEYHAQTNTTKGRWIYYVGTTNLSLEEINRLCFEWISKYPTYKFYSDNCRRFTSEILTKMILNPNQIDFSINFSDFLKSPCRTIENLIRSYGFNAPKHLQSTASKVNVENLNLAVLNSEKPSAEPAVAM